MDAKTQRIIAALIGPDYYARNREFVKPGATLLNNETQLQPDQEAAFEQWVQQNNVPFDLNNPMPQDYDMRGFYRGLMSGDPRATTGIDPNDQRLHFTDYWKTPYHESFSRESKFAAPNAPTWQGDQLITPDGTVVFDDAEINRKRRK